MAKIVPQPHGGSLKIPEKGDRFNPKGRPKSLFKKILESTKGIKKRELPTKQDIEKIILMLSDYTADELQKIAHNKNANMIIKRIARYMATADDEDVINFILNRTIGTPTSAVQEINVNISQNNIEYTEQNIAFFNAIEQLKQ